MSGQPEIDCPESQRAAAYVAGSLSEPESAAFEEHYFACDRCYAELRRALELRAALGEGRAEHGGPPATRRWSRRSWSFLLAAAVLLVVVGLASWLTRLDGFLDSPEGGVLRGDAAVLTIEPLGLESTIEIRWRPVAGAERYRVSLFSPDGGLYEERETAETELSLEAHPRVGETLETALRWVVQVEGLDGTRRVVARSRLTPVDLQEPGG